VLSQTIPLNKEQIWNCSW